MLFMFSAFFAFIHSIALIREGKDINRFSLAIDGGTLGVILLWGKF
jgi:hypothetical protein